MDTNSRQQPANVPVTDDIGAVVFRGKTRETVHHVSIAVVDARGKLTHYAGDPFRPIATRSSVKPFQAIPLVKSGAAKKLGLTSKLLAVVCASHNGTDEHRAAVLEVLKAAGNDPSMLQCGSHWPMVLKLDKQYPTAEQESDPTRHNCSGKHSGFLALTKHLGGDVDSYLDPESATQTMVREAVGRFCGYPPEELGVAIDGCSAPVFTMPLINLAIGFKRLASAEGDDESEQRAVQTIRDAMYAHPVMISGEKRFDYDLARSFPDNLVCKVGAEAVEGIGLRQPAVGIAVKVHDGADRICPVICVEVLRQLGIIGETETCPLLARYVRPEVKNYRQLVTGHIVPEFRLRTA